MPTEACPSVLAQAVTVEPPAQVRTRAVRSVIPVVVVVVVLEHQPQSARTAAGHTAQDQTELTKTPQVTQQTHKTAS